MKTLKISLGCTILVALAASVYYFLPFMAYGGEFPRQSDAPVQHASSTAFTLTWGAERRIVATSTLAAATASIPKTSGRSSLSFQTVNCGAGAQVWISFNDIAAATSTGYWLTGSSTLSFGDTFPMVNGSIRALASTASCTLLVNETRTER